MINPENLIIFGVLMLIPLITALLHHLSSGESLWRLRQIDRNGAVLRDVAATSFLFLFLVAILPVFGRTGPVWRRPPFLLELAGYFPLIIPVALICGFLTSLIRRLFRSAFAELKRYHRLQLILRR